MLRTAGGHRRIPRKCLEELLALGGDFAASQFNLPIVDAVAATVAEASATEFASRSLGVCQSEFREALGAGKEARCRELLNSLIAGGFTRLQAADSLITDAMHHIGHRWEQGEMAIYQERRACGICLGLIHELKQSIVIAENAPIAIGGSPEGDVYQLPTLLVELALCESGWRATSLGCNVPMRSMSAAVSEYQPRLLWISMSAVESEDTLVEDFNELVASLPKDTAVIVGGRAANDSLRPRLRYTAHCDSLANLTFLASAFLAKQ